MHFPRERVLGVHLIIKEACEPLSNPTLSFGRFMRFRAKRTQTCHVHVFSREGRPGEEAGSVQHVTQKSVANLRREPSFLIPRLGVCPNSLPLASAC